jgi:hypothetical protein
MLYNHKVPGTRALPKSYLAQMLHTLYVSGTRARLGSSLVHVDCCNHKVPGTRALFETYLA